ncbi:hypothetical protein, partial [Klebsiella pneumoniae]
VIDSGYILRSFHDPFSGFQLWRVSDKMYGNKQHSSLFNIDDFVKYIQGDNVFEKLPSFTEITVKNYKDIESVLSEPRRRRYINEGRLSFRGQVSQYTYKRKIPNPVRADENGNEISIFPGLYRQKEDIYSFSIIQNEKKVSLVSCKNSNLIILIYTLTIPMHSTLCRWSSIMQLKQWV